jgi:DNA-binding transcriptional LysR family regulator
MNPQRLAVFSTIVQAGSISQAAKQMGCGKSVLSRQLAKLEADLGARLIQRSTRRLTLTEIGELVLAQAQTIDQALVNIEQLAGQYQQEVRGRLRVTCPAPVGQRGLAPLLVEFTQRYPQVDVVLQVEDRLVDLIAEHIDVAIRVSHLEDSSLVARKLTDNTRVLVAAPSYLARAGTPGTPQDLAQHDCLLYTSGGRVFDDWQFSRDGETMHLKARGRLQTNDGLSLVATACAGGGVMQIDRLMVTRELASGALVELLPQYSLRPGLPIYAVYPARPWLARKTAVFIAFLQERLFV